MGHPCVPKDLSGTFSLPSSKEPPFPQILALKASIPQYLGKPVSLYQRRHFPKATVVSSSKSKHMLAPRLAQYPKHLIHISESMLAAWLLSALLTPDPAPFFRLPFLFCPSLFFVSLSSSLAPPPMVKSSLLAMFSPLLSLSAPDS